MGMFDDVAAEHERTKHIPKPTSEEIARAKWDELGLAELAEEYAHFARRENIPMLSMRDREGFGHTAAWPVHGRYAEYEFHFGVLSDGSVLPIRRVSPSGQPLLYQIDMWHSPWYDADTVRDAFRDTAKSELERRDGIA